MNELCHYGVKGMKWGVRRNRDRLPDERGAAAEYNGDNEDPESLFSKNREITSTASLRFSKFSNSSVQSPTARRMSAKGKKYLETSASYKRMKRKKVSSISLKKVVKAGIAFIKRLLRSR